MWHSWLWLLPCQIDTSLFSLSGKSINKRNHVSSHHLGTEMRELSTPGWVFATFFPLFSLSHGAFTTTEIKALKFRKQTFHACNEKIFMNHIPLLKLLTQFFVWLSEAFKGPLWKRARARHFCQGHRCSELFSQRSEESTEDSPKRRTTVLDFRRSLGERLIACRVSKQESNVINQKFLVPVATWHSDCGRTWMLSLKQTMLPCVVFLS